MPAPSLSKYWHSMCTILDSVLVFVENFVRRRLVKFRFDLVTYKCVSLVFVMLVVNCVQYVHGNHD